MDLEKSLSLLSEMNQESRDFYNNLRNLYVEEYGEQWFLKELREAKENFRLKGNNMTAIREVFNHFRPDQPEGKLIPYIGTKQVSMLQYILYCCGLYWLAAYEIFRKKQLT